MTAASLFEAFLEHNQPDPGLRQRLQVIAGFSTRRGGDWTTPIVHVGPGATGKTTFERIIAAVAPHAAHLHSTALEAPAGRIIPVMWAVVIPPAERDPRLAQRIIDGEARIVRDWLTGGTR